MCLFPKTLHVCKLLISRVHISSDCTVNSHIVFSDSLGTFFLSQNVSLVKHTTHRNGYIDLNIQDNIQDNNKN